MKLEVNTNCITTDGCGFLEIIRRILEGESQNIDDIEDI